MLYRLIGGARERRGPGYGWDAATRGGTPHAVVQLTLAGEGWYADASGRRPLPAGSAFVQRMPGPYRYGTDGPYELLFAGIGGDVDGWVDEVHARHGPVIAFGDPRPVADALRAAISAGDAFERSARAYALMMAVLAAARRGSLARDPRVERALAVIDERAGDAGFGVGRLAEAVGCSREHLTRRFRQTLGTTPADRLTLARLRLAAAALRAGDDKLAVVARRSGFASASYLCRSFRRHVGVTPRTFRDERWVAGP